jgi:hypothetical protein
MGRKPKMIRESYKGIHFDLPESIDDLFRAQAESLNLSLKDYFMHLITYRDMDQVELDKLKQDLSNARLRVAELEHLIYDKERQIEEARKIKEDIEEQQRYAITSFRILFDLIDSRGAEKKILLNPAIINSTYGIAFNIKKCNENWDIVREMPDGELISYLSLRKLENVKARKNIEILEVIRKKNEVIK